jgi:hypothetical protein
MNTTNASLRQSPHYLFMFKLYVKPDGSLLVTTGNQHMEVTADEAHALLCGTLEYARVFAKLHQQIDTTTLSILPGSDIIETQA